jgi:hypothetical protein
MFARTSSERMGQKPSSPLEQSSTARSIHDASETLTRITPHEYPFVPFRALQEAHVNRIYWKGDPKLPERYATLPDQCSFVIGIQD